MRIWVDADACPGDIKELIIRAAIRLKIAAVFVANKYISVPESAYISAVRVGMGPEVADDFIARSAEACDFVITQDIPLASVLVPRGVVVIDPRGGLYSEENIRERLSIRNFMQDIREAGGITPGPKQFGRREKQRFSATFDRELTRCLKKAAGP
ncbi:MAG: YaiI/YqxD family protein [Syntrophobacteraceae bacterium]